MTAKAYRLVRAILMTAVDDGTIARNPCRIRGAGSEPSPERPVLTVAQVFDLAPRLPEAYGVMVLVTTFGSLRWGEVTALRRMDVEAGVGRVFVRSAFVRRYSGEIVRGAPKSRAGDRVVILPRPVAELLAEHLAVRVRPDAESLIFPGDRGGPLHRGNFNKRVKWSEHVTAIGLPGLHLLSRLGARFRHCYRSVSPSRSPNPPCRSLGNGLSTVSAIKRGSWVATGMGSCCPGRSNGRPSPVRSGRTRPPSP